MLASSGWSSGVRVSGFVPVSGKGLVQGSEVQGFGSLLVRREENQAAVTLTLFSRRDSR